MQHQSVHDLEQWMLDRSELEAVLEEEQAWRYIKMNMTPLTKLCQRPFSFGLLKWPLKWRHIPTS